MRPRHGTGCTADPASYGLRRLRLTGLNRRIEHTCADVWTPGGQRPAIFYTEQGRSRPRARRVSDVSGSLQIDLGIFAGGAHLILMSQTCGLLLLTSEAKARLRLRMTTRSTTTVRGWTMTKLAHSAAMPGTAAAGGSRSG
jgi:hypothetical protein